MNTTAKTLKEYRAKQRAIKMLGLRIERLSIQGAVKDLVEKDEDYQEFTLFYPGVKLSRITKDYCVGVVDNNIAHLLPMPGDEESYGEITIEYGEVGI